MNRNPPGIHKIKKAGENGAQVGHHAGSLPHQRLSDREFDVFRRIAAGETITEIAQALSVSVKTVSTYKTRILEKMQMPHEAALVRYAVRNKLIEEDDA